MILTLTSRKGGCGKTVLAMVIAAALAEQGGDVALLDADSNGSAYRWATDILHAPTIHPAPSGSPICFLHWRSVMLGWWSTRRASAIRRRPSLRLPPISC
jgi:hypothetical protein